MQPFDKLWDYNNPAETEARFRSLLNEYPENKDKGAYLQLLTQLARTYSLRRMFTEAHDLLNEVKEKLGISSGVEHIRYHLERGRTYNSAGKNQEAKAEFEQAKLLAVELKEDFYAIDAIHMLAIISAPLESVELNKQALLVAEESTQERAKGWIGSLFNNLGWGYFDLGQYELALSIFLRALKWRQDQAAIQGKETSPDIIIAKWTVARTLRALNRIDEAITIQLGLLEELIKAETSDGYVYEELGELYLLKGEEIHKMYFQFAYNELSKDIWLAANEQARLNRMKELAA